MTIRVKIGDVEKDIAQADSNWINEQINRRRADGVTVCIQVTIVQDSVNLRLATVDCPQLMGGSPVFSTEENEIISLWENLHLREKRFTGGNLVAFLKQISARHK